MTTLTTIRSFAQNIIPEDCFCRGCLRYVRKYKGLLLNCPSCRGTSREAIPESSIIAAARITIPTRDDVI